MNTRIKELDVKAKEYAEDSDGPFDQAYTEKFAELIVKECAKIALSSVVEPGISVANARSVSIFMAINKHFGIKE